MIYVMSDIHGNLDRFQSIMRQIRLGKSDHLYVLGDVIDRYPKGVAILRQLMKAENVTVLKGNHEFLMEKYYQNTSNLALLDLWYNNGGRCTHEAFKHCRKAIRDETLHFIAQMPLNVTVDVGGTSYLLVHGAPAENYNPRLSRYKTEEAFAVWQRLYASDPVPDGKTVIFGHTPTSRYQACKPLRIWRYENKIGIDCGCGISWGRLACLRLDDGQVFYSEDGTKDEKQEDL